jgi:hypothetical protein
MYYLMIYNKRAHYWIKVFDEIKLKKADRQDNSRLPGGVACVILCSSVADI